MIFKRILLTVLICLLLLNITACNTEKSEKINNKSLTSYEFECNNGIAAYYSSGETGMCIFLNFFLYYVDYNTMEKTPICNKPDCLHDKEELGDHRNCNAYFGVASKNFAYIEDKVYIVCEETSGSISGTVSGTESTVLYEVPIDGSNRKELLKLDDVCHIDSLIHKGYVYLLTNKYDASKGHESDNITMVGENEICRMPLSNLNYDKREIILDGEEAKFETYSRILAYKDYFIFNLFIMDGDTELNKTTIIDLNDFSVSAIEYDEAERILLPCLFYEDVLLFAYFCYDEDLDEKENGNYYTYNFKTKKVEKSFYFNEEGSRGINYDNDYVYAFKWGESLDMTQHKEGTEDSILNSSKKTLSVYSRNGEEIKKINSATVKNNDEYTLGMAVGNKEYILRDAPADDGISASLYYIKKSDLLTKSEVEFKEII